LPGGEFEGISCGDYARNKGGETVIVLGYSEKWDKKGKMMGNSTSIW